VYPGNKTGKNPASGEKDPFEEKTGNNKIGEVGSEYKI
jgi:hypothetical protein